MVPKEKGDALERAVHVIESTILKTMPEYSEKNFTIRGKQIVVIDEVKHEIDLWVEIDLGVGYKAIFIFECKNWKDSVGKNEVIIFAEKIEACQAQQGFMIAKEFTRYARAQAEKRPRLQLLLVTEADHRSLQVPLHFHYLVREDQSIDVQFFERGVGDLSSAQHVSISPAKAKKDGQDFDLEAFIFSLAKRAADDKCRHFPSGDLPGGVYKVESSLEQGFEPGGLVVGGHEMERLSITIKSSLTVVRPPIVSSFEVEGRGRVLSLRPAQVGKAELTTSFVEAS